MFALSWPVVVLSGLCFLAPEFAAAVTPLVANDPIQLKTLLEQKALDYFLDQANPDTGLVRDSAFNFSATPDNNRMASIAATGFGLAVLSNAQERGLLDKSIARAQVRKTLDFTLHHVASRNGWLLHFVDWQSGERFGQSEYSTIDTAFFVAGALYAKEVFQDPQITLLADALYENLNFQDMLTDGGSKPQKQTLSMAYFPEAGYTEAQWSMPAEQMLLLLLGLGHPTHPLPTSTWLAWTRDSMTLENGKTLIGYSMPLFVHQYSQLFVDLRNFHDQFANYFANGALGTTYNRDTCRSNHQFLTLRSGFWGLSAGDSPQGYAAHSPTEMSSTVCIGCVVGSAMYDLDLILDDVLAWVNGSYSQQLWGRYGLVDSLDLDQNWFAQNVLGITVGPLYMSLANSQDSTSIWSAFNKIPEIRLALIRAQNAKDKPADEIRVRLSTKERHADPLQMLD